MKVFHKCVSVEPSATYHLSPEQIQFFHDNGYILVKKLIGLPALNSYRQRFIDVCNGRVEKVGIRVIKDYSLSKKSSNPEDFINKIQELVHDDVFTTYVENPQLLQIVSQLIGNNLTAIHSMLINKPPGSPMHPPHQDMLHFPIRPAHLILGSWTAIDPSTRDTGCLYVVPKSHKPHEVLAHDAFDNGLPFYVSVNNWETIAPEHKRVYIEMDPGDTILFSSTLVHGSLPNLTKAYRKAISCHYANSNCQYVDVSGTAQEPTVNIVEAEMKKRGLDMTYADLWKLKGKTVRGVRCNL